MVKQWKLKINSSNILLVLITLILIKAKCAEGENDGFWKPKNTVECSNCENRTDHINMYVGNDEIAEYFFHSSINNNSFILNEINRCLDSFQLITCVKMLLLSRINDVLNFMEELNIPQKDIHLLNGILIFKIKNDTITEDFGGKKDNYSLDEEIEDKVKKIFRNRSLSVNLLPTVKIEIEPASGQHKENFVCFKYNFPKETEAKTGSQEDIGEGRKKKGGGMSMMMMVPQLIMLGLMPFTLASLKAMVMNAVMINMMALNGAIFMTIRNLVFGPRQGDNVKYVNYGYSKNRQTQSPKPVLIIHSPAAFVKQPTVHKKQVHGGSSYYSTLNSFSESHYPAADSSFHYHNAENIKDYANDDYYIPQNENSQNKRQQGIQKRNEPGWMKINTTKEMMIQNKNINQNKFKQVKNRRQETPSLAQIFEGTHYKTNTNFEYPSVSIKRRKFSTK